MVNIGPQHPSTHGVFRMRLELDGEVVVGLEPVCGYLHRGIEKLMEGRTYVQNIPLTDRLDYMSSMTNNFAYCLAVEKLGNISVPDRAEYLRVIFAELQRIVNHLVAIGAFTNDCGAFFTPFMYMFREREKIVDLFEMASGQRLTYNYFRPGGLSQDIPDEFLPALKKFLVSMPGFIEEYEQLFATNEILLARAKGIGVLTKEQAINMSASGPVLRACGVKWDIRKADPYSVYDQFEFDIPTYPEGDCYARYRVRVDEMRQSLRIINQAVEQLPAKGEIQTPTPLRLRLPAGEGYIRTEAPKGELGFYIVSDKEESPYRIHIRAPSFINLTMLPDMAIGLKLADAIVNLGSIDICLGEVDR